MGLCPNNHENLGGLSQCRVCGLPLLDLPKEFASLADSLSCRAEMGRCSPNLLLVGLGTAGASLTDICTSTYADHNSNNSYLAIDTDDAALLNKSSSILRLRPEALAAGAGTFCGIGEDTMRSDPHLVPGFRKAGLNHKDDSQAVFLMAGIGGGIGSAASVVVEKCRQLNPSCHTVALIIVPGADESFHNHLNAYYGLSRLLENGSRPAPDLVIAARYDRTKMLRGVGAAGQELINDSLLAAFSDLLMKNLTSQYITEVVRINRSMGVRVVVPCLALGRSLEIFGSLTNVLESAIAYPANYVSMQAVLACHLLIRVPSSQAGSFEEEAVNEHLWALARRHLPNVKAASSSVTYSDEQHDRIKACILLGGDSATGALFADEISLTGFREELDREIYWETYGLNKESIKLAGEAIKRYDHALEQFRGEQRVKRAKVKRAHR